ncbi:MAG: hypothetical protein ACK50Q_16190 [Labrys sp. (in: a-proteobacteria)]
MSNKPLSADRAKALDLAVSMSGFTDLATGLAWCIENPALSRLVRLDACAALHGLSRGRVLLATRMKAPVTSSRKAAS